MDWADLGPTTYGILFWARTGPERQAILVSVLSFLPAFFFFFSWEGRLGGV